MYRNFKKLNKKSVKDSIGQAYEELDLKRGRSVIIMIVFYYMRRILIPISVIFCKILIV